jgi:hypothetical protein
MEELCTVYYMNNVFIKQLDMDVTKSVSSIKLKCWNISEYPVVV